MIVPLSWLILGALDKSTYLVQQNKPSSIWLEKIHVFRKPQGSMLNLFFMSECNNLWSMHIVEIISTFQHIYVSWVCKKVGPDTCDATYFYFIQRPCAKPVGIPRNQKLPNIFRFIPKWPVIFSIRSLAQNSCVTKKKKLVIFLQEVDVWCENDLSTSFLYISKYVQ